MPEPIAYVTTRHRCPHCRRSYANKATAVNHMARCFTDPERRTCKTCRHDEEPYSEADTGYVVEGGCALNLTQGPSCIECGEHPEVCGHSRYQPANRLRVLCPSWAAPDVT